MAESMGTLEKMRALRKVPLFSGLLLDDLEKISRLCTVCFFPKGSIIFEEHSRGDSMYIIIKGKVRDFRSSSGGEAVLAILRENEYFGEMAILDGKPRSASVMALEDSELLRIEKDNFRNLVFEHPEIALEMLRQFSQRLRK